MSIRKRKYQPSPHIAQELLKFPSENITKKQIQQFLAIVNYFRDFVPKFFKYTNFWERCWKKIPKLSYSWRQKLIKTNEESSKEMWFSKWDWRSSWWHLRWSLYGLEYGQYHNSWKFLNKSYWCGGGDNMTWRLTWFYCSPNVRFTEDSWNLLKEFGRDHGLQRFQWDPLFFRKKGRSVTP